MKNINTMNGKRFLLSATIAFLLLLMINPVANAQVGIGTATPNAKAALDIVDAEKGLLTPRVAITAIQTGGDLDPATLTIDEKGMMVYVNDESAFYTFNGTEWEEVGGGVKQQAFTGVADLASVTIDNITSVTGVWKKVAAGTQIANGEVAYNFADAGKYTEEDGAFTKFNGGVIELEATPTYGSTDITMPLPSAGAAAVSSSILSIEQPASEAFDNNLADASTWISLTKVNEYIGYQFATPKVVAKFSITNRDNLVRYTWAPSSIQVKGSNNGTDWVALGSEITGISWSTTAQQTKAFTFENKTAYTYYALFITRVQDVDAATIQLASIEFFEFFNYQTAAGYHVTTTAAIDVEEVTSINSVAVTETATNGIVRYFVSNNGTDWKYFNGSSWLTANDLLDATFETNGMTKASLEGISAANWDALYTAKGIFQIAAYLKTSDASTTPSVDNIAVNYDTPSSPTYVKDNTTTDFKVSRVTATGKQTITIKNLSGAQADIVVDYIK